MIKIDKKVIHSIRNSICVSLIESGGIIGSSKRGIITNYYFDFTSCGSFNEYIPNTKIMNNVIEKWGEGEIKFCGMIHSHPKEHTTLSFSDIAYAKNILYNFEWFDHIYMIIVTPESSRNFLSIYQIHKDGNFKQVNWCEI